MERGWAIFCPLQAELRSSSSLSAAKKRLTTEDQESAEADGQGSFEGKDPRETENTTEGIACGTEPQEIPLWETLPFLNLPQQSSAVRTEAEQLPSESKHKARAQAARDSSYGRAMTTLSLSTSEAPSCTTS